MPWAFYSDPALTTPVSTLAVTTLLSGDAVNQVVYFGNPAAGLTLAPAIDDSITVAVIDAATGSGLPAAAVRLATSEAALVSATPGVPLDLGASLASGAGGSVAVWLQVAPGAAAAGAYNDLSLATNDLVEVGA